MSRRVVITGLGAITPIGNTTNDFWDGLKAGKSGAQTVTRFDITSFSAKVAAEVKGFDPEAYIEPKEVKKLDLFTQYAIAASIQAVDSSGLNPEALDLARVGVLIGSGIGGIQTIEEQKEVLMEKGPRRISPFLIPKLIINMASGMVSMRYGFRGPNTSVVTACATGNHAIGDAMRLIQRNDAEVMVAGGTEAAITPLGYGGFANMKALSTRNDSPEEASRPFDLDRDGFVMGEGAGIVVLEELEHAKKRGAQILGEIVGYGMTADAYHMTMPEPEGRGASEAIRLSLADAQLQPEEIGYVNAHGTSTPYNDKFETQAIKNVFGDHAKKLAISSTKSMTGHLLGASGAIEFVAVTKALQEGVLPPTINYSTPDPDCDLDYIPNEAREQSVNAAISNSFGFGGHNAVLTVKKFN